MFIAFIMKPMGDIDWIKSFETQAEADTFALDWTDYGELDPEHDNPDHWEKYDPPVVLLFEAESWQVAERGKYTRPVAIYQRGKRFDCVPAPADNE